MNDCDSSLPPPLPETQAMLNEEIQTQVLRTPAEYLSPCCPQFYQAETLKFLATSSDFCAGLLQSSAETPKREKFFMYKWRITKSTSCDYDDNYMSDLRSHGERKADCVPGHQIVLDLGRSVVLTNIRIAGWAFDLDHLSSHTWLLLALNQEDTPTQVSHSLVLTSPLNSSLHSHSQTPTLQ
ncbi:hypothetical protein MJG53_017624 [Ovis ammon polii x Ovis aries]|uniref:Uncharacterized protein n=1 Tax=Ovis ammon polii x Ovis aries TaxID=2918886 RepID=A0ACB9U994_9CETA|nr:hypothetical protein MJG53_017624 [Ovis ammon polii x Ovis aries]